MAADVLVPTAVALAATYALLGAAVSLVGLTTRTLHLAIGELLVVGTLVQLVLATEVVGVEVAAAVGAGVVLGAGLGAALEPLVLRRLPPGVGWLVGLAAAGGVIQALTVRTLGTRTLRPDPLLVLPGPGGDGPLVPAVVVGVGLALVLSFVVHRTGWGRRLRIVGSSEAAAVAAGSSPRRLRASALAVAGAAAVVAGLLVAPITFVSATQGATFTVRAVAAAVLVGRGGPASALAGGAALGAAEALGLAWWPAAGGEIAVASLVLTVLAWRGSAPRHGWGRAW